ncbi:MAG TPA: helix-turn-helix transcriptional regulator [Xanthobacteraceae bacterium]|jgi:XRE family transcriptional regulator, aerobic/anaerobic benzoate catabolism transcriptional regulator|nr:helix-turn-helix transcriptional regulator [Xanthobacteraceae bacterium]
MTDTAPPYISNRPPRPVRPKPVRVENTRLLREIGRVIRSERAKRGMTRKILAKQSGMSERFVAQIELGEGNPSVLSLDALARALNVDLFDLLPAVDPDVARRRALIHLRQLPVDDVTAFLQAFSYPGSAPLPSARGKRIALVGLRGAGKSTLGKMLAERLNMHFIELDKIIEQDHGAPVATLFDVYGQATFRRYEREALTRIAAANSAAVIATAGGIVADESTFAQLLEQAHVIWLRASPTEHMRRVMEQGDFRPMERNEDAMNDLIAILDARAPDYGRSHACVDTSGRSPESCVNELMKIAGELFASNLPLSPVPEGKNLWRR